jgi:peptidyl-prolyl cis-trans isomerase B (cyclophilin B)
MIALTVSAVLAACAAPAPAVMPPSVAVPVTALADGGVSVEWESPTFFVDGLAFTVTIHMYAPSEGGELPVWALTPAAFELDGQPLQERKGPMFPLAPNERLSLTYDLAPYIAKAPSFAESTFTLKYAYPEGGTPMDVQYGQAADQGLDFMTLPVDQLTDYQVLLSTNRGDMLCEFWPDVAPNHVRNFLDLSYTGFYDDTLFHRVIPGFMIQGGDPTGTGTGSGKRQLTAEFNERRHVPGVLSMARGASPDSASCQFFVMHGNAENLDGSYSAFGRLVSGLETVEKIVNSPRSRPNDRPNEKQIIQKAVVLKRPTDSIDPTDPTDAGGQ